ncbi:InlB B-repeat-containing protein [Legionella fallonii]|uniref:Bacterial repeat domain-containing protein n=1 Tax=Legionella fallonii LLAP-10 TaxID=1212491 RepID=A0A098G549_9GAMM|nr:PQQ-like beta-propeller repeat protein [Legionella fallonii]CEG56620.1 conserved exported protein of unknown function [Legionella fallonii LLAP-10]
MKQLVKTSLLQFFTTVVAVLLSIMSYAGKPLWTFNPDPYYPPTVSITTVGTATIKYKITNNSRKTHTLAMQKIQGITPQSISPGDCSNPFILTYEQSCTLNLLVDGKALTGNVSGGPIVCQQGGLSQCYQPDANSILNITRIPVAQYLITPTADVDGTIKPNTPQTVIAGSNLTFTATPSAGYQVDQWIVDDGVAQKGGTTLTLSNIETNHTVEVTFARIGTIYAGTLSGLVYFSTDNGLTWTLTTTPSPGNTVNSVFSTPNTLYVGSADGKVYYSTDNGTLWSSTNSIPGATPVNSVFVTTTSNTTTIYVGTSDGTVYSSTDGGTIWNSTSTHPSSSAVNSIFITPSNTIYLGSQDGNVYFSENNGMNWHQITGPEASIPVPIQNVFATNSQLYVNTRQTSSNNTLPNGTIDFEYAYFSNSLTDANPTWTLFSQISYTLFVNSDASVIHAGTQGGYVYSLTTGDELGFITYSPITSLFFLG